MKNVNLVYEYLPIDALTPYEKNARKHADFDVEQIATSIERYGFDDPIGVWGEKNIIVEGHGRLLAAKTLGMESVPCVRLDHLTEKERHEYAIAHNRTAELSLWDDNLLQDELKDLDMDWLAFDEEEEKEDEQDEKYSDRVGTVQYEPKETNHKISDLYTIPDPARFDDVIQKTGNPELIEMLKWRKGNFVNWDFSKIADYYAYQATPDEQRALEAMGLVLMDKDDLIANGFANLMSEVDVSLD